MVSESDSQTDIKYLGELTISKQITSVLLTKYKSSYITYIKQIALKMSTNAASEQVTDAAKNIEDGKAKLSKWLNTNFRIEMTDGRVLIGVFLCTDRDANVILGACSEYLKGSEMDSEEPRVLGLVMVPGRHIVSIQIDDTTPPQKFYYDE